MVWGSSQRWWAQGETGTGGTGTGGMFLLGRGRMGAPELLPAQSQQHQYPISRAPWATCCHRAPGWMQGVLPGEGWQSSHGDSRAAHPDKDTGSSMQKQHCSWHSARSSLGGSIPQGVAASLPHMLSPGSGVQGPCRALPVPSLTSIACWLSPHTDPVTPGMLRCHRHALCCPPCSSSPQLVLPRRFPASPKCGGPCSGLGHA